MSIATFVVPDIDNPTTPAYTDLTAYSTIVWYTGDNDSGEPPTLSSSQLQNTIEK